MAQYTNEFPAKPNNGDKVLITKSGNYVFARGEYQVEAASAKGGNGGMLQAWTTQTGGNSRAYNGGYGGNGLICRFGIKLEDMQNALSVAAGKAGTAGWGSGGSSFTDISQTAGTGTAGAAAQLTVNGAVVASISGGAGGTGASIRIGAWQSDGTRSVSGSQGAPGVAGKVISAPTGYTTATNAGDGYIKFTILSLNSPPTKLEPITYAQPLSGRELLLNCALSTDPDPGDSIQYVWEYRTDAGAWKQIAITSTNQATITVPTSGNNITFRVKAVDNHGAESDYAVGSPKVIIYNFPPTISGVDEDRGEIHDPFVYTYSVDDQDLGDILTVTVYLDTPARQLDKIENAVRNKQYSFDFAPIAEFVSMGNHVLVIHAQDDQGGEAYRRIAFTRYSNKLEVELEEPIKTKDLWATLIPMINYAAGNDYILTVKVKNDPLADWEDVTPFNHAGQIYQFINDQKTTAGDCEFYCYCSIEKGPSRHPIEFRGGTFICNANGIEVSYATGVKVNTSLYPSQGSLGPEHATVQQALNALSIAAYQAGLKILDAYGSEAALRTAHPVGTASDMYAVWDSAKGLWNCYVWSASAGDWKNIGPISGIQGQDGKDGKSAYDIWLAQGNVGSEQDFINALKGAKGDAEDVLREPFLPWDEKNRRYVLDVPMAEIGRTRCFFTFGDYGGNGNAPVVIYDGAVGKAYDCYDLQGAAICNWQLPWNGDAGEHMLYGALEKMGGDGENGRVILERALDLKHSMVIDGASSFSSFDGMIYGGMYFIKHDANLENDPYPWQNKTLIVLGNENVYGQLMISSGGLLWRAHDYDGDLGKFAWTAWEKVMGASV